MLRGQIALVSLCLAAACADSAVDNDEMSNLGPATLAPPPAAGGTNGGQGAPTDGTGSTGDAGVDGGRDFAAEVPADAPRSFRCDYDNLFADPNGVVKGCKDYPVGKARADALTDCMEHKPAAGTGKLSEGSCDLKTANGYCSDHAGSRDVGYLGGCDATLVGSGAWACAMFIDQGTATWSCLISEPNYRCVDRTKGLCRSYRSGTTKADADADCAATLEEGSCSVEEVVGTCLHKNLNTDVYEKGACKDYESACDGTFKCLTTAPPDVVHSCHVTDRNCTLLGFIGCSDKNYCVDYRESAGFTAQSAQAACNAEAQKDDKRVFSSDSAKSCEYDSPAPTERCVKADGSRRYGESSCTGTKEPIAEKPATMCTNSGVVSCRYESTFTKDNCADFETAQCWTEADVKTFCAGQQGAKADTVKTSVNNTCLAAKSGSDRCKITSNGKVWYAYGMPQFVCTGGDVKGEYQKAPHSAY